VQFDFAAIRRKDIGFETGWVRGVAPAIVAHVARWPKPASRSDVGALIAILHDRTRSSDGRPRPSSPSKTMDFWRSTCTRKSSRRSASPHWRRQVIPESAAAEGVSGTCFDLAGLWQLRWRGVRRCASDWERLGVVWGAQTVVDIHTSVISR
jgi:hypothetical protein